MRTGKAKGMGGTSGARVRVGASPGARQLAAAPGHLLHYYRAGMRAGAGGGGRRPISGRLGTCPLAPSHEFGAR
jgi:hypothetical protein